MSKIAYFGGTFDPIHKGHIHVISEVLRRIDIDKLYILPNNNPPHKHKKITEYRRRVEMINLSIGDIDGVDISYIESDSKVHYTYETLERIKNDSDDDIYFIIGEDSLLDFDTWKNPKRILELSSLIVLRRYNNSKFGMLEDKARDIRNMYGGNIEILDIEPMPVSSTKIREMVFNNEDISDYVDSNVKEYILRYGLYK